MPAPFLPFIPLSILRRHEASVLDPATATVAPGWGPKPLPTVYRTNTLMVTNDALDKNRRQIDAELGKLGLGIVIPENVGSDNLPRPVRLSVNDDWKQPVVIDAWPVLQHLRTSLNRQLAESISIEHLLFASDLTMSGVEGAWSPSKPPPLGATATASYTRSRSSGRLPVVLFTGKPPASNLRKGQRRPVVAVLDTGIAAHRWLDVKHQVTPTGTGFVAVDEDIQKAIVNNSGEISLAEFWEQRIVPDTLVGELDTHWGHGTFITGVVRQAAPRAQVLAIRVMFSDGIAHEADVLCALDRILSRVKEAQDDGRRDRMVDVVSLSFGYYPEVDSAPDQKITKSVEELARRGVLVVAAAGNDSTLTRFYPAALARHPVDGPQLVSVGSLNPNQSKALFSNDGDWVTCWAPGASVVSTFPQAECGSLGPDYTNPAQAPAGLPQRRDALDEDDFSSGFVVWNGTSFAAPMVAARLANKLMAQGKRPNGPGLDRVNADKDRAARAANAVGEYVWPE
jgi:hypothetical protein